jgi:hypothetical protein
MNRMKRISVAPIVVVLAVVGAVLCGGVADAKKRGKAGKGSSVSVSRTTATVIPPAVAPSGGPPPTPTVAGKTSLVAIPLKVGKKGSGKIVSPDSVSVTYSLVGTAATSAPYYVPGTLYSTALSITAPNGRTVDLNAPAAFDDPNATATGPTTETANSPLGICSTSITGPLPSSTVCSPFVQQDPENTVVPPTYAGTIGNPGLAWFAGIPAKGTWLLKVRNYNTKSQSAVTSVTLDIGVANASSPSKPRVGRSKK